VSGVRAREFLPAPTLQKDCTMVNPDSLPMTQNHPVQTQSPHPLADSVHRTHS